MKRTILVASSLFAIACGGAQTNASVEQLRAAVPRHDWLSMSIATARVPGVAMCTSSGASTYGAMTHRIAGNVDGVLAGVFGLVEKVTSQQPAASEPGQAMWGPITGASSVYTLAVEQASATEFHFFLGGEAKGAGDSWRGVFGGTTAVADPLHRSGEVDINFGVMHALDPSVDPISGGAAIQFSFADGARDVRAHFGGIVGKDSAQPTDNDYAFTAASDQTAGFAFATHVDYDHDGTSDEVVQIQSRWAPDGSGTAHIVVSGGSLGQSTINAVECWDPALGRVYFSDDQDTNERVGDPTCCPF